VRSLRKEAQLLLLELFQRVHAHESQVGLEALDPATDAGCGFENHGSSLERRRLLLTLRTPQRAGTAVDGAGIADDAESLDKVPVSAIAV
jgi:hypothetical protein